MASREAAFDERKVQLSAENSRRQQAKFRLVSDPYISVQAIQDVLEGYVKHRKCNDLAMLLAPPPAIQNPSWQSPPSPDWMAKCLGLVFDVLSIAPNTKLAHTKVRRAIVNMWVARTIQLDPKLGKPDDQFDNVDLNLRMVMNQFREVKVKADLKQKVLRVLSAEDGIKVQMVLDKIILPKECYKYEVMEDDSQEAPGYNRPEECLAIVPFEEAKAAAPSYPLDMKDVPGPKPALKRSYAFSEESLAKLGPTPEIFGKILAREPGNPDVAPKRSQATGASSTDDALLSAAASFVPTQLAGKAKAKAKGAAKTVPKGTAKKGKKNKKIKGKTTAAAKSKAGKAKSIAKPSQPNDPASAGTEEIELDIPKYVVEVHPTKADTYKNLYVSRHYNKAKELAIKHGASSEQAKARGRVASAEARKLWDDYHPN